MSFSLSVVLFSCPKLWVSTVQTTAWTDSGTDRVSLRKWCRGGAFCPSLLKADVFRHSFPHIHICALLIQLSEISMLNNTRLINMQTFRHLLFFNKQMDASEAISSKLLSTICTNYHSALSYCTRAGIYSSVFLSSQFIITSFKTSIRYIWATP